MKSLLSMRSASNATFPNSATPGSPDPSRKGQWFMVGGGILLGTLGVFLEQAGQPALTAVWFRCAFGLLALTLWLSFTRERLPWHLPARETALAVAAGLSMVASWALFFEAVPRVSMSVATLVVHVQPFLIMVVGALWLNEPTSPRQWGAAALALLGLGLSVGGWSALVAPQSFSAAYQAGIGLALGAALAYAAAPLLLRRVKGAGGLVLAWWQCLAGTVALAWWPLWNGWPAWGQAWAWLAGMGVLHTGLAYVLLYAGVTRLPAGRMALLQFVYPASAIAFDALVYGRLLAGSQLLGVVLLLAGLFMALRERQLPAST